MMKLLALLLALASWAGAGPTQFETKNQILPAGVAGLVSASSPTYALNAVTSTVASSAIDLSATGSLYVCVSGSAGADIRVSLAWSNTPTASTFLQGPYQLLPGCWPVNALARYLQFSAQGASRTVGTTVTAKTTVNYYVIDTRTALGNVNLNTGTAYAGAVGVSNTVFPVMTGVSNPTYSVTTANMINLTAAVGVNGPVAVNFSTTGPNPFYWRVVPNSTWVEVGGKAQALSATPILFDNLAAGSQLELSVTAAALTSTVEVDIWKVTAP